MISAIANWASRTDMLRFATSLTNGSQEEKLEAKNALVQCDYYSLNACAKSINEVLKIESETMQILCIKRKLLSFASYLRTERLQSWLDAHLFALKVPTYRSDDEREAHKTLAATFARQVAEGSLQETDLKLAAKVVSGALKGEKLVSCLLQSFLDVQQSLAAGHCHTTTSKFVDEETVNEIVFTLGQSAGAKAALRAFHVNPKVLQGHRVDFQHSLLPRFFCSCRSNTELEHNGDVVLERLNCKGARVPWQGCNRFLCGYSLFMPF